MKKVATCSVLLVLFYLPPVSAYAQNGSSNQDISINVSAQLIHSVELITIRSMRLSGAEAQNDIIVIDPVTSINAGKMIATGIPNSNIRLSFLEIRELVRLKGPETLTFTYSIAANTVDDQSTAELLDGENRNLKFNSEGQLYIWIGGRVDISTAVPGSYQGEFTLEIEYI